MIILSTEEQRHVDKTEVVLVGKSCGQFAPPFFLVTLDANYYLRISVLEVLDEEGDWVIRSCEKQSSGELAEEWAQFVFLTIDLHVLAS